MQANAADVLELQGGRYARDTRKSVAYCRCHCLSAVVVGVVSGMLVDPVSGIIAGLATIPLAIVLDWETRRRRELAVRSKASEGD